MVKKKKEGKIPDLPKSCFGILGFRYLNNLLLQKDHVKPAARMPCTKLNLGLRPVCACGEQHVLECSLLYLAGMFCSIYKCFIWRLPRSIYVALECVIRKSLQLNQAGRRQNMRSKCRPQSMFVPCICNPFWSTVALVPPWLDVTEWGVLGHTRATKGRNLGCFAEIDPRIDSHSWASTVNGGMLDNSLWFRNKACL